MNYLTVCTATVSCMTSWCGYHKIEETISLWIYLYPSLGCKCIFTSENVYNEVTRYTCAPKAGYI